MHGYNECQQTLGLFEKTLRKITSWQATALSLDDLLEYDWAIDSVKDIWEELLREGNEIALDRYRITDYEEFFSDDPDSMIDVLCAVLKTGSHEALCCLEMVLVEQQCDDYAARGS